MAILLNDIDELQTYAKGVMKRAEHHAGWVKGIALTVFGAILLYADSIKTASVAKSSPYGPYGNMLWITIGGRRFAVGYSHAEGIQIHEETKNGRILHSFNDQTSSSEVQEIFSKWKKDPEK